MSHPRLGRVSLPILLGVFFLSVYLLTGSSDLKHNGDTDLRYQTTQAMVDHHQLWIAHPMWTDARVAHGRDGHYYAYYGPGQSILMVPLYIAGKFLAHHFSLPYDVTTLYLSRSLDLWLGALLAVVFFLVASALGFSAPVSTVLTLIFGLATTAWPDAQSALEQTQVSLLVLVAVLATLRFAHASRPNRGWIAVAGMALGMAICTRYDAVLFVALVPLYAGWRRWERSGLGSGLLRDATVYGLSLLPWAAVVLVWNYLRFGSPLDTGLREATFGGPVVSTFLGLLVSPGKGLIWYVPLLVLLAWAGPQFHRQRPMLAAYLGLLFAVPLIFYSNVLYWHGDPAWGPRYLYPSVPYLVLPLGMLLAAWRRHAPAMKSAIVALVVASFFVQVTATAVSPWRFWYRLEALQQSTVRGNSWTGQPFHWGAGHYHYYWDVGSAPILIQLHDVYQVAWLTLGTERYRLTTGPDPYVSNPADNYPINTFVYWWADDRHPIAGFKTRAVIASGLGGVAILSLCILLAYLRGRRFVPNRQVSVSSRRSVGEGPTFRAGKRARGRESI